LTGLPGAVFDWLKDPHWWMVDQQRLYYLWSSTEGGCILDLFNIEHNLKEKNA
jgi:hypothetical protein